jgi:hypothetical protein
MIVRLTSIFFQILLGFFSRDFKNGRKYGKHGTRKNSYRCLKGKELNQQNYLENNGVNVSKILKRILNTMVGC